MVKKNRSPEETERRLKIRELLQLSNIGSMDDIQNLFKEVTKSKSVFPTDDSLFKMLYLAMIDITKKWTGRRQDWSIIHAQMALFFADRMPE